MRKGEKDRVGCEEAEGAKVVRRRGLLSLISVHVCNAIFLQGFLVSFSRHQRVHSQESDTNGSVKGAYALWPG